METGLTGRLLSLSEAMFLEKLDIGAAGSKLKQGIFLLSQSIFPSSLCLLIYAKN